MVSFFDKRTIVDDFQDRSSAFDTTLDRNVVGALDIAVFGYRNRQSASDGVEDLVRVDVDAVGGLGLATSNHGDQRDGRTTRCQGDSQLCQGLGCH